MRNLENDLILEALPFDHDVHHRGFWPKQLMEVWSLLLQTRQSAPLRRIGTFGLAVGTACTLYWARRT